MKSKTLHEIRKKTGKILGGRFAKCGSTCCSKNNTVNIFQYEKQDSKSAFYNNVVTCGSYWSCPVCASKKSIERSSELADIIKFSAELNKDIHFVTLTLPHHKGEKIEELKNYLVDSWRYLTSLRGFKKARESFIFENYVKSIEVTYGINGWHPHIHLVFISDEITDDKTDEFFKEEFYNLWEKVVKKISGKNTSINAYNYQKAYKDYKGKKAIAEYLNKWDLSKELCNTNKESSNSKTPLQLAQGDKKEQFLFKEFSKAFKGVCKIRYSRGFKELRKDIKSIKDDVKRASKKKNERILKEIDILRKEAKTAPDSRINYLYDEILRLETIKTANGFIYSKKQIFSLEVPVFNALKHDDSHIRLLNIIEQQSEEKALDFIKKRLKKNIKIEQKNGCIFVKLSDQLKQ